MSFHIFALSKNGPSPMQFSANGVENIQGVLGPSAVMSFA
jgi:hypothetical protein